MDLERLSQKQLAELALLLQQQEEAYEEGKLDLYRPHPGQLAFHKSDKRIRVVVTGNRWGKTTASVIEATQLCLGIHPYHQLPIPIRGKMYGESFPMIDETLFKKFEEWVPKKFLKKKKPYSFNQRGHLCGVHFTNESEIVINSYDQTEEKAEGSNWHFCAFDEPPPRNLYIANWRGLVDFRGLMWFTATPLSEPWIFDDLWEPGTLGTKKNVACFGGAIHDNIYLTRDAIDDFDSELTEQEREVRIFGKFSKLQGVVLDTYDPRMSDIDPFPLDHKYTLYEGIDPHSGKPHCALWKAIDKTGHRFVVAEVSCPGGLKDFAREIHETRQRLTRGGAHLERSICDTSLNQKDPNFRQNLKDELTNHLRNLGESVFPQNAQKRDWLLPGIFKLKDLYRVVQQEIRGLFVRSPMQFVFNTCLLYKKNMTHYQWPKVSAQGDPNPIAKFNDYIDCDRYIESIAPEYVTPGQLSLIHNNNLANSRIRDIRKPARDSHFSNQRATLSSPSPVSFARHAQQSGRSTNPQSPNVVSYKHIARHTYRGLPK